jgi:uncharacterized repeat protein (TIGR03843 family)
VSDPDPAAEQESLGPDLVGPDLVGPDLVRGDLDVVAALELLRFGDLDVQGRLVDASNATLYCGVSYNGVEAACVYKPVRGERPLWDFPDGTLAGREVGAYLVSAASGWNVVPPTLLREGPFGAGMVQLWIDGDPTVDLTRLVRADDPALRRMAIFDVVVNNADRKGGHLIPMPDGHVYGVDHGICFHSQPKLRTVLWTWAGDPIPEPLLDTLARLRAELDPNCASSLGEALAELLTAREVAMTRRRIDRLLRTRVHPEPSGDWPPVPWPPF